MFTWTHEHSFEVDIPQAKAWDIFMDMNNWLRWIDDVEAFEFDHPLKKGSIAKGKVKKFSIPFIFTEIIPPKEFRFLLKTLFLIRQESFGEIQELSPTRSRIVSKITVKSILCPFLKGHMTKNLAKQYSKMEHAFLEMAQENGS